MTIKSKIAVLALSYFFTFSVAAEEPRTYEGTSIPMEYRGCNKTSECVLVEGVCGEWAAVFNGIKAEALKWIRFHSMAVECAMLEKKKARPEVACVRNVCEFFYEK